MPLAFSQEDFLVQMFYHTLLSFSVKMHCEFEFHLFRRKSLRMNQFELCARPVMYEPSKVLK